MFLVKWSEKLSHSQRAELIKLEQAKAAREGRPPRKINTFTPTQTRSFGTGTAAGAFAMRLRSEVPDAKATRVVTIVAPRCSPPARRTGPLERQRRPLANSNAAGGSAR